MGRGGDTNNLACDRGYSRCYLLILERDDIGPHEGENPMRGGEMRVMVMA